MSQFKSDNWAYHNNKPFINSLLQIKIRHTDIGMERLLMLKIKSKENPTLLKGCI